MIKVMVVLAMVVTVAVFTAIPASADRSLGIHIAGMTPDHAVLHGSMFGECVSEMATTGGCPHQ